MKQIIRVEKKLNKFFVFDEASTQKLYSKNYGYKEGIVLELNSYEVLYLLEKEKIEVYSNSKLLKKDKILQKSDSMNNYIVYSDLKSRGYNVKSGLKYGFIFRVYDKGKNETKEHAIWLVEPLSENDKLKLYDLTGKNRIAHSTKKKLLLAIVDDEKKVTYIETSWKKV